MGSQLCNIIFCLFMCELKKTCKLTNVQYNFFSSIWIFLFAIFFWISWLFEGSLKFSDDKKIHFYWTEIFNQFYNLFHQIKLWSFPNFWGCFAYWNQNHQLWNQDPKSVQFVNRFQISQVVSIYWDQNQICQQLGFFQENSNPDFRTWKSGPIWN